MLTYFAVREGKFARADSLSRLDNGGKTYTVLFQVVDAYHRRDVAAQEKLLPLYARQIKQLHTPDIPPDAAAGIVFMSVFAGDIASAEQALELPVDSTVPGAALARRFGIALVALMRGQLKKAEAVVPSIPNRDFAPYSKQLMFEPFRSAARADLLRFREQALRSDSTSSPGENPNAVLAPQFRLFYVALANCQLGNIPEALQQADRIESMAAPAYWREAMRALATDVRAFADVAKGNDKEALRRIESIPIDVPIDLLTTPANRRIETLWHGELLYRVGRYDEAMQWFENLPADLDYVEITPFALLRRAQIYDRRRDTKQAALLYAQFLDYWKNPDPELQPLVRDARNRLAAIHGKVD